MDGRTKYFCPSCMCLKQVQKAMCVDCGTLIGCTAVSHDQARPFHGCQDNGILVSEILKLTRERNNAISVLEQIVNFEIEFEMILDFRMEQVVKDIKQLAQNALKDHDEDS